jgi:hypothetical protein
MPERLIACIIAVFLCLCALPAAAADFEAGLAAKERGDYAAALRTWRPLAEQGYAEAQNALGVLYDNGEGVPQDHARAIAWYRKAARKGNAEAENNLGMMYANGLGVPQDYAKAAMWYRKAAARGNGEAKVNLGVMRLMGRIPDEAPPPQAVAAGRAKDKAAGAVAEAKTKTKTKTEAPAGIPAPAAQPVAMRDGGETAAPKPDKIARIAGIAEAAKALEARQAGTDAADGGKAARKEPAQAAAGADEVGRTAPAAGPFHVQLSSVKTRPGAMKEAARLKRAHDSVLGSLTVEPVRADLGARGVFYRLRAGPLASFADAQSLCRELSARNQGCIVIRQ